jgi:hypothetical protein
LPTSFAKIVCKTICKIVCQDGLPRWFAKIVCSKAVKAAAKAAPPVTDMLSQDADASCAPPGGFRHFPFTDARALAAARSCCAHPARTGGNGKGDQGRR